ncbi:hypothetical protein MRB53_005984 [Persea americana]|uniref:Uncharacterized protein n=1 Tax=Persea americana TaxID=3435 RepID=A0ACC2MF32_PERAE|nr:hypothetical protein MRB53_005984 [Persea americana]
MEDSFNCRVDKIFGSLLGSSSSSSSSSSSCPWTLSDAEIERKQWNRDKGDSDLSPDTYQQRTPSSSSSSSVFNGFFSSEQINNNNNRKPSGSKKPIEDDLEDLDDDDDDDDDDVDEDEKEKERDRPEEDCDKEELEIRNGIGTDCTLDYEDEEDEYDKVAVGTENAGDRVYMSGISDYGPHVNYHNILLDSFEEVKMVGRDPRANHLAARARLQEDEEAAGSFNPLQAHDDKMHTVVDSEAKLTGDGGNVKPILKRKDNHVDSKPKKRVRFNTGDTDNCEKESEQAQENLMVAQFVDNTTTVAELENAASPPKSVTFTPRKKTGGPIMMDDGSEVKHNREDSSMESAHRVIYPVSIAVEAQESEVCAMEEDDLEMPKGENGIGFRKSDRKYRSKVMSDDSNS